MNGRRLHPRFLGIGLAQSAGCLRMEDRMMEEGIFLGVVSQKVSSAADG
jgi:hypothetical protein